MKEALIHLLGVTESIGLLYAITSCMTEQKIISGFQIDSCMTEQKIISGFK